MIWRRVPKETYVGSQTLGIGVASATISFNDGMSRLSGVFKRLNMEPGKYTMEGLHKIDCKRVKVAEIKNSEKTKKRRKALRRQKKGYEDKHADTEGTVYDPGMGD